MRKTFWECDNCQTQNFDAEFPKTWIHLKSIMVAEGTHIFGRVYPSRYQSQYPNPNPQDFSAYRREFDKTFCSADCYVKYLSKMFKKGDTNFNPSMKVS
jgi:hypothetical protein